MSRVACEDCESARRDTLNVDKTLQKLNVTLIAFRAHSIDVVFRRNYSEIFSKISRETEIDQTMINVEVGALKVFAYNKSVNLNTIY